MDSEIFHNVMLQELKQRDRRIKMTIPQCLDNWSSELKKTCMFKITFSFSLLLAKSLQQQKIKFWPICVRNNLLDSLVKAVFFWLLHAWVRLIFCMREDLAVSRTNLFAWSQIWDQSTYACLRIRYRTRVPC